MPPGAASLHCPNCGAPADPDARRCPYCRARLAAVTCPTCFAALFDGAAFCPACGAARVAVAAEPSSARCPGCGEALSSLDVAGMAMLECRSCDGAWVDSDTFDRICTSTEARAAVLSRPVPPLPAQARRIKYRPCVRCGKMMNRVNFGRLSGTVIDVCKGHGTFLDSGELHAIVTFIQGGGLERVRRHDLAAIEDATRQLHAAQTSSLHGRRSAEAESSRWDATSLSQLLDEIFGR